MAGLLFPANPDCTKNARHLHGVGTDIALGTHPFPGPSFGLYRYKIAISLILLSYTGTVEIGQRMHPIEERSQPPGEATSPRMRPWARLQPGFRANLVIQTRV